MPPLRNITSSTTSAPSAPGEKKAKLTRGEIAQRYAERGFYVFPVHSVDAGGKCTCGKDDCGNSTGKHPRTTNGFKDATTDLQQIADWWQKWPDANVAIDCGRSRLVVIDVDPRHGGDKTWAALTVELGPEIEDTARNLTPQGGKHFFFRAPKGTAIKSDPDGLDAGVEVKAEGAYVIIRGRTPHGAYLYDPDSPRSKVAPLPESLRQRLTARPKTETLAPGADRILEGQRNTVLTSMAGTMRHRGFTGEAIEAALQTENAARCDPPLSEDEVARIARSVARYEPDSDISLDPGDTPVTLRLSDVEPEPITWVRPQVWPRGKLSVIAGDPGLGKSFVTLDAAARISRGAEWPEGGTAPLGNVVILTAEDALDDTVRPRLDAMKADVSRIISLQAIKSEDGQERMPSLARDLLHLETVIREYRPVMVIIDPLTAYLGGKADAHKDADVRGLLAPLARLADTYETSIVAVMHLNKGQLKGLYRISGSIAFTAAARSVFLVIADPESEATAIAPRRFFVPAKMNVAAPPPAYAFGVFEVGGGAKLLWEKEPIIGLSLDAALATQAETQDERYERQTATEWLRKLLEDADGHMKVDDIKKGASEAGWGWRTIEGAKTKLRVKSDRVGFGADGYWAWFLPKDDTPPGSPSPKTVAKAAIPLEPTEYTANTAFTVNGGESPHPKDRIDRKDRIGPKSKGDSGLLAENGDRDGGTKRTEAPDDSSVQEAKEELVPELDLFDEPSLSGPAKAAVAAPRAARVADPNGTGATKATKGKKARPPLPPPEELGLPRNNLEVMDPAEHANRLDELRRRYKQLLKKGKK